MVIIIDNYKQNKPSNPFLKFKIILRKKITTLKLLSTNITKNVNI